MIARTPRIVVTAHLPTPASNRRQAWLGAAFRRGVDVQIVPGEWARSELARYGQLARYTVIVPNAIDMPDHVSRAEARGRLGLAPHATVVGGVMRLEAYKRPDLVAELAHTLPGVTVVLFGDGPELDHLAARANGGNVLLTGFRSDASTLVPRWTSSSTRAPRTTSPWPSSRPWQPASLWWRRIRAGSRPWSSTSGRDCSRR